MSKKQMFVAKGFSPWFYPSWIYMHHANIDESVSGQATVTYDKELTDMPFMFYNCYKLTKLDLSNFDTSNVEVMTAMFYYCSSLTELNVSNFDTSEVEDMDSMFANCSNLTTLDLSDFDTSNVTDMSHMFFYCTNLIELDLSNFDTSNVTDMDSIFYNCCNLTTIKGVIDMKSCTDDNYEDMFYNCPKLTGVKIKNPPADFESKTGLSSSQYIVVNE